MLRVPVKKAGGCGFGQGGSAKWLTALTLPTLYFCLALRLHIYCTCTYVHVWVQQVALSLACLVYFFVLSPYLYLTQHLFATCRRNIYTRGLCHLLTSAFLCILLGISLPVPIHLLNTYSPARTAKLVRQVTEPSSTRKYGFDEAERPQQVCEL